MNRPAVSFALTSAAVALAGSSVTLLLIGGHLVAWCAVTATSLGCSVALSLLTPRRPSKPVVESSSLTENFAVLADALTQLRELADGMRAQMVAEGYSETVAEAVAAQTYMSLIAKSITPT